MAINKTETKADSRIIIDGHLGQAGWGPTDKAQVQMEVTVRLSRKSDEQGCPDGAMAERTTTGGVQR